MNDRRDSQTEEAIRRTLRARAEEVTVSPDALDRIRNRPPSRGIAIRSLALAGVAAVVALLVGIAVVTQDDDSDGELDVADTTSSTSTSLPPSSTTDPVPTTTPEPTPAPGLPERVGSGYAIWPTDTAGAPTAEAAARGWVEEVLGLDPDGLAPLDVLEADVGAFTLAYRGEDGGQLDGGLVITVASPDGGEHWLVAGVEAAELRIDLVERNGFGDSLRVTGWGSAFEGTGLLWVDGEGPTIVGLGSGPEGDEFTAVVPWDAEGPVQIRLESGLAFAGQVPAVVAFATDPEPPSTDIRVVRVAIDDVLNMRSGPGVDNDVVFELDPYASALTHTERVETVGGEQWWEIMTTPPERVEGWVNARFLSVQREVVPDSDLADELIAEARRFLTSFGDPGSSEQPDRHPYGVEIGGIGIFADAPTPFQTIADPFADTTHDWAPFASCDDICVVTTSEFLDVGDRDATDAEFVLGPGIQPDADPGFVYQIGLDPEFFARAATVVAYIAPSADGELDWKRYTFAFDFIDGSPTIRSVWRWGWTP